ncbi:MAG: helix-turn-helix transcriptional regulator [Clostridiales bacterium]|jgi:DNA-binding Xre family transcriptional regulator|nr:helix-turn-helix transcriptional regulator [Clostridiales bacterium]
MGAHVSKKHLHCAMIDKDLNFNELHWATGLSKTTISKANKGGRCSMKTIKRMAAVLGVDANYLMDGLKNI